MIFVELLRLSEFTPPFDQLEYAAWETFNPVTQFKIQPLNVSGTLGTWAPDISPGFCASRVVFAKRVSTNPKNNILRMLPIYFIYLIQLKTSWINRFLRYRFSFSKSDCSNGI